MEDDADSKFSLSGAEKKKLRGKAQLLEAKLSVGKNGVTAETLNTLAALFRKEPLVKIRFAEGRAEMKAQIAEIELGADALCVGHVGRTASFYKPVLVPAAESLDAGADEQ